MTQSSKVLKAHGRSERKTFIIRLYSPAKRCRVCTKRLEEKEQKKYEGFCYDHYITTHQPIVRGMVQGGNPGLRKKRTLRIGKSEVPRLLKRVTSLCKASCSFSSHE